MTSYRIRWKTIAVKENRMRLSWTFATNWRMLRTVLVYVVGACQNTPRKLSDSVPRVIAIAGMCTRLRENASFLLCEETDFSFSF
jgi:hypothetical protein